MSAFVEEGFIRESVSQFSRSNAQILIAHWSTDSSMVFLMVIAYAIVSLTKTDWGLSFVKENGTEITIGPSSIGL